MEKSFRTIWIFVLIIIVCSCTGIDIKNSTNTSYSTSLLDRIIGKWNVTDMNSSYNSFEFNNVGNDLILVNITTSKTSILESHFGTYHLSNQSIALTVYGLIKLTAVDNDSIHFTFTPAYKSDSIIKIKAVRFVKFPVTVKTELLSRTWQIDSLNGNCLKDSSFISNVFFSNSGTYYAQFKNSTSTRNVIAQWTPRDDSYTRLCYSLKGEPVCDGINEIKITELTLSSLKYRMNTDTIVCHPVMVFN